MGAGAFVMAEFTKPRTAILSDGLGPALLYFLSVLLYVHVLAVKSGFEGMQGQTGAWRVLLDGLHFLLPLALITALLLWNYSPVLVGVAGSGAVLLASLLRSHTRIGLQQLLAGLRQGAMLAVSISVACAGAGLVVGTIGQTGIGLQFTESVVALSGGQLAGADLSGRCGPGVGHGLARHRCLHCSCGDDWACIAGTGLGVDYRPYDYFLAGAKLQRDPAHCAGGFRGGGGCRCIAHAIRCGGSEVGQRTLHHSIDDGLCTLTAQYRIWLGRRSAGGHGHRLVDVDAGHAAAAILVRTGNTGGARDRIYRSCAADLSVHRVTSIGHLLGDGSYVGQSSGTNLSSPFTGDSRLLSLSANHSSCGVYSPLCQNPQSLDLLPVTISVHTGCSSISCTMC